MTRTEVLAAYKVTSNGIIQSLMQSRLRLKDEEEA